MKRLSYFLLLLLLAACRGGPPTGPLAAPTNLGAAAGQGEIVLTWTDNSTAEAGFRIFRKSEGDEAFPELPLDEVEADIETYTDTAVSSAETYVYQVQAYSDTEVGEFSVASNPAQATQGAGKVRLTVLRAGSAKGFTTSNPPGINCENPSSGVCSLEVDPGTTVILTADPDESGNPPAIFAGFSGACTTTALTCEVVVDTNKDVTATYNPAQPGLTVQISGEGRVFDKTTDGGPYINCSSGSGDCNETGYWPVGSRVDLFAEAADGYTFEGWSDNCDLNNSDTSPDRCIFTLGTSTVISARFEEIPDVPVVTFTEPTDLTYRVGTPITLRWTVQNGPLETLTLNGQPLSAGATSAQVTLPATDGETEYRLEARNGNANPGGDTISITTGEVPRIGEPAEQPRPSDPPLQPNNPDGSYTLTWTPNLTAPVGISRGDPATYTYTLTPVEPAGATRAVNLTPGAAGSYVLALPAGTTPGRYRLEASNEFGTSANAAGTGSDEFTIAAATQTPNPTITGFTAPDTTFATGGEARLEWGFAPSGATPTGLSLLQGDTPAAAPCQPVTPTATSTACPVAASTSFRLQVQPGGNTVGPVPITVGLAPSLSLVTFEPITNAISWSTTAGDGTVTYDVLDAAGTAVVLPDITPTGTNSLTYTFTPPLAPGTYNLRAKNEFGLTPSATPNGFSGLQPFEVTAPPAAPGISFAPLGSPEDLSYAVSTPLTLSWTMQNGPMTSLTLNGAVLDVAAASDSVTLPATATTTEYRLEARNASPTPASDTLSITTGEKPKITAIEKIVDVSAVPPTYQISWTVDGDAPTKHFLTPPGIIAVQQDITAAVTFVSPVYSYVFPAEPVPGQYTLTSSNDFGDAANVTGDGTITFDIP
jgi:hypothetical protein